MPKVTRNSRRSRSQVFACCAFAAAAALPANGGERAPPARGEELQRTAKAGKWASLPFQWAIKTKQGDGRRNIAVFSDPNCPYCRAFERELAGVENLTVYVFPYPVISAKSERQAKAVWCSEDRAKAWNDLLLQGIEPPAAPDCDTPIEELVRLGRSLGANATPTWFLETGERYRGALPMWYVRRMIDRAAAGSR